MLHVIFRATQVGVLAGESNEVHIVLGTAFGVVGRERDDGGAAGGVVVGPLIEHLLAEVAEMVVVRREDVAAVVPPALHLGDDVEEFVVLQKLVLDVDGDGLGIFREVGGGPDDGLAHHLLAVCLVEFQQGRPRLDHPRVGALGAAPDFLEVAVMTIREPEVADHEAVLELGFRQVRKHLLGIVVVRIDIVESVGAAHAGRVLAHREIDARGQLPAVNGHFHLAGEGVDVDSERLAPHFVHARFLVLFQQVLPRLVGAAVGIAAPLVFRGVQLLDNPFVVRQILRVQRRFRNHRRQYKRQY